MRNQMQILDIFFIFSDVCFVCFFPSRIADVLGRPIVKYFVSRVSEFSVYLLGGGFKYFLFSSLFGEASNFD